MLLIANIWKQPKRPVDEWIKKMWYMYAMEYYLATKKNGILPFETAWVDLEGIMLSERQTPYDFTEMWSLKSKINEQTK